MLAKMGGAMDENTRDACLGRNARGAKNTVRREYMKVLLACVLLAASPALAEADSFYLGSGRHGSPQFGPGDNVINYYAPVTQGLLPGEKKIPIGLLRSHSSDTPAFVSGDLVMVFQTTGLVPPATSGDPGPFDLNSDAVGRWELARVASVKTSPNELTLTAPLVHSYAEGVTQVILVREYSSVVIGNGQNIVAEEWDGKTGGVVAFLSKDEIVNNGKISAAGKGFRGGLYIRDTGSDVDDCGRAPDENSPGGGEKGEGIDSTRYDAVDSRGAGRGNVANGGGGGVCSRSGGGGGGNAGHGGQGGNSSQYNREVGGMGGASLAYSMLDHLTFGGGGGSGHGRSNANVNSPKSSGGRGGGLVFLRGKELTGTGTIEASGMPGLESSGDGAGGGGAGGAIVVRLAGPIACGAVLANGGAGGRNTDANRAPGGGGGGGRILYQTSSATLGSCSLNVNAGVAGSVNSVNSDHYGATPAASAAGAIPHIGRITALAGTFPNTIGETVNLTAPGSANAGAPGFNVDGVLTISGETSQANRQVVVYVDGIEIGRTAAGSGKNFSLQHVVEHDGFYTVEAAVVLPAQGLQGPRSNARYANVDTVKPAPPLLIEFNSVPVANGLTINNRKPGAKATTTDSDVSSVLFIIQKINSPFTVSGQGTLINRVWTWAGPTDEQTLTPGSYTLEVRAMDVAGHLSKALDLTEKLHFSVDIETGAPVVSHVAGKQAQAGMLINTATPGLRGTAEAGSTVTLEFKASNGSSIASGSVVVDANGGWGWVPGATLPGSDTGISYTLEMRATDKAGNTNPFSGVPPISFGFKVDTRTQTPVVGRLATKEPPANGIRINDSRPGVAGQAESGSFVTIYIDGIDRGRAEADQNGNWSWPFSGQALGSGLHELVLVAKDPADNVSPISGTLFFYVDLVTPVPRILELGGVSVSSGMRIKDTTPDTTVTAEPGSTATLTFARLSESPPVDVAEVSAKDTDGNGTWTLSWAQAHLPSTSTPPSPLEAGQYQVEVLVRDAAGNQAIATLEFTVDTAVNPGIALQRVAGREVSPGATEVFVNVLRPLVEGTVESSSKVRVEFTQAPAVTVVADGNGLWRAAPGSDLMEGSTYQMEVSAEDEQGNTTRDDEKIALLVKVDTLKPQTRITSGPPIFGAWGFADFQFECTDPGLAGCSIYECSLDGVIFTQCSSPYHVSNLSQGDHFLLVRAVDGAGNNDETPASYRWRVTNDSFAVEMITKPTDPTNKSIAAFEFLPNRTETPVTYECRLKEPGMADFPVLYGDCRPDPQDPTKVSKAVYPTSKQGRYELEVKAVVVNTSEVYVFSHPWTYDTHAPKEAVIEYPGEGVHISTRTPDLNGTVPARAFDDSLVDRAGETLKVEVRIGSSEPMLIAVNGTRKWSYTTPPLRDGEHSVSVKAMDDAGNVSGLTSRSFTVDTRPPLTSITRGAPAILTNNDSLQLEFMADEPLANHECNLDLGPNGNFTPCGSEGVGLYAASGLQDGSHSFYVRSRDRAGNIGPYTQIVWTVDTLPPETFITKAPDPRTNQVNAVFEFQSETGAVFECNLNKADFKPCKAEDFLGMPEGEHELQVRAVDRAGNEDLSPGSRWWVVDLTDPVPPLVVEPAVGGVLSTVLSSVRGSAEPASHVVIYLDGVQVGEGMAGEDGRWIISLALSQPDGTYALTAKTTDEAGNTSNVSDPRNVRMDATPPETEIRAGPPGQVKEASAAFELHATGEEGPASFRCSLDNGDFVDCASPLTYEGLSEGVHVLKVVAVDAAQNQDMTPASWNWRVGFPGGVQAVGGGVSCAATRSEPFAVAWLGLMGLLALSVRRRKS